MSTIHARFRLEKMQRTATFAQLKQGEYPAEHTQTDVGTTVTLSQIRGENVTPTGKLSLVLNSAEAKVFHDAPMGTEFDLVIARVAPGA